MSTTPCGISRVRDFLKQAEDSFSYEVMKYMTDAESFRIKNVREEVIPNQQGGPTYKVMRGFTKTDYQFDFGSFDQVMPNNHDSGCLTDCGTNCNIPATQVGGSGWQTIAWTYFREKLRTVRHCLEDFRDIPEATEYLREMRMHLADISTDRLDMFMRGLEYYYSVKHIVTGNGIREIAAPFSDTQDIERSVRLVDCADNVLGAAQMTPRILTRIYNRAYDLYGRELAMGMRNSRPYYGLTASSELIDYYHIDNPEIFDEIRSSDQVNPLIQKYGLSQVLGQKLLHIHDEYPYRANVNADGSLTHERPYHNITIEEMGQGFETVTRGEWRQADLEYVMVTGKDQFTYGYQDAFMPLELDDYQEIGKKFDWRLFNDQTCEDEDANWFHYYATSRFYIRPNFRKNLAGFYFPVNPERLDARFFGSGDCPTDPKTCPELRRDCLDCVDVLDCCDHQDSGKLLVTFVEDAFANLDITDGAAGFIITRDGDHLPVILESQSAKDNRSFVVDFTPANLTDEPCCADGEMISFYVDEPCLDDRTDCSCVQDACPLNAAGTEFSLYLERPLSLEAIVSGAVLEIKFSDGSSLAATSTGSYDAESRILNVTPATPLTAVELCRKYITDISLEGAKVDESDTPCSDLIEDCE